MIQTSWKKGVLKTTSFAASRGVVLLDVLAEGGEVSQIVKSFPAGFSEFEVKSTRPLVVVPTTLYAKSDSIRTLRPIDESYSHSPFPYDPNVFERLRPDQVPRFLGALTDSDRLERKTLKLSDLTAVQNRVDRGKVESARSMALGGKPPVVVRMEGRNYIADGHHRLSAAYLNGALAVECAYLDLSEKSNAMKGPTPCAKR